MNDMATLTTALVGLLAFTAAASPIVCREQVCNGNADFCNRKYSNVSLIGTHDSAFVGNIIDPRINQEKTVTEQLDAGIRFLQAQTHNKDGTLEMCHTSCDLYDAGTLSTYLSTIKTWLDSNPDEVLTLLLVNGDNVAVSSFGSVFNSTGLASYAFTPTSQIAFDAWPTYSQLISNGTRLITFLDAGADTTKVSYIQDEFTYFFETPYDTTDPSFNECALDRPAGSSPDGKMYIVNHFLDTNVLGTGVLIPDNAEDYETNAATGNGSIGAQVEICEVMYGRVPNFVLVDMFDRGDVFTAQANLNA